MNLSDERLCWLAVKPQLDKKAGKLGLSGWLSALAGGRAAGRGGAAAARLGGDLGRDKRSDKLGDYAIAVDEAAQRLSREERTRLRATGQVPDWFLAEVESRAKELGKQY
jgi:hypothetical protein